MTRPPDYRYWAFRELWTVRDAVLLLLGIRAGSVMSVHQLGQINTIMEWAQDAMDIGTLAPFSSAENSRPLEDRRVRPTELLKWWQSKGFQIPTELAHLLDTPDSDRQNPVEQTARTADHVRGPEKTTPRQEDTRAASGEKRPGDLQVVVDNINEAVMVFSKGGHSKREFKRADIVGKGIVVWDLLVAFAKYRGSLEGIHGADIEAINTSVNRKNLGKHLMNKMNLNRSPIIENRAGAMCFGSIQLAGDTSRTDALDRKTISLEAQGTEFLRRHGEDMPPID